MPLRRLPSQSDIQQVQAWIGKRCQILNTIYVGTVVGVNNTPYGLFPGHKYPVNVKLDSDGQGQLNKVYQYPIAEVVVE